MKFKIQCLEKYLNLSYERIKYIKLLRNKNYFQRATEQCQTTASVIASLTRESHDSSVV
jgi:hypothetical protein